MEKDWMLDIETLGTSDTSIILSIGAVSFNLSGISPDTFYLTIDPEYQTRSVDISTLKWWFKQIQDSATVQGPPLDGVSTLDFALTTLFDKIKKSEDTPIIWANGTDFDLAIIKNAAEQYGIELPWKYFNVRDYRTLRKLFPAIKQPVNTNPHNALEDAKTQALHCIEILKSIKEHYHEA